MRNRPRTASHNPVPSDDRRWLAVQARDPKFAGAFVYAVKTTRIYCRPGCSARTPNARNVEFFATPAQAVAAGFRACRRCRPESAPGDDPMTQRMVQVASYIRRHAAEPLSLAALGARASLSPAHLQRTFKAALGVSPKAFHAALRLQRFKARLRSGADVLDATFDTGYGSTSRVYAHVDGGLGMTPAVYRAGGAGEHIRYAVRTTALGALLMAATERGVCCVQFGESAAALHAQLQSEFPNATLEPVVEDAGPASAEQSTGTPLDHWIDALNDHLSHSAPRPTLPLDLRGTVFQIKVWRFLLSIPSGDVVSYSEVAQGVGAPQAVRAAASACAANRVGVLIPCHRALRADGTLGGYRWGVERKRALLDAERTARSADPTPRPVTSG